MSAAVAKRLDLFGVGFVGFVIAAVFWLDPQFHPPALVQVQLAGPVPLAAAAALISGVRLVALRRRWSAPIPT